jgi:hypothetical protein
MVRGFRFGIVAAPILFFVGGCGGGGGSSLSSALVSIDSDNAELVAAAVVGPLNPIDGFGEFGSDLLLGAVVEPSAGEGFSLADFSRRQLESLKGLEGQLTSELVVGVVHSVAIDCDSGSMSVAWDDADDDDEFSSGDTFSITFNNCRDEALGLTMNGQLALSNFTLTGDPFSSSWSMVASFSFKNLRMTDGAESISLNGGYNYSIAQDGTDYSGNISGSSLTLVEGGFTHDLRDFTIASTFNEATNVNAGTYEGRLISSRIGGSVVFTTPVHFEGVGDGYPYDGRLKITGADDTSVTLIVIDSATVWLEVDSDGDGSVDDTIMTTWEALAG